eukprot:CAMPEP_0116554262 /NCGR_PEP_ID=MMETSP0397-20121206/7497_1 /TAXON_ID=216820 /ORGANISM="Cyclophora tenuis, Strain ECT3854" /LENGTH=352 /DNA_ID=CAMNT_0004079409 /DNA_START=78 /DNA_END=1136 /DNA_ORIENTATION=-
MTHRSEDIKSSRINRAPLTLIASHQRTTVQDVSTDRRRHCIVVLEEDQGKQRLQQTRMGHQTRRDKQGSDTFTNHRKKKKKRNENENGHDDDNGGKNESCLMMDSPTKKPRMSPKRSTTILSAGQQCSLQYRDKGAQMVKTCTIEEVPSDLVVVKWNESPDLYTMESVADVECRSSESVELPSSSTDVTTDDATAADDAATKSTAHHYFLRDKEHGGAANPVTLITKQEDLPTDLIPVKWHKYINVFSLEHCSNLTALDHMEECSSEQVKETRPGGGRNRINSPTVVGCSGTLQQDEFPVGKQCSLIWEMDGCAYPVEIVASRDTISSSTRAFKWIGFEEWGIEYAETHQFL